MPGIVVEAAGTAVAGAPGIAALLMIEDSDIAVAADTAVAGFVDTAVAEIAVVVVAAAVAAVAAVVAAVVVVVAAAVGRMFVTSAVEAASVSQTDLVSDALASLAAAASLLSWESFVGEHASQEHRRQYHSFAFSKLGSLEPPFAAGFPLSC